MARRKKPVRDGISQAVRNLDAVAFLGGVIPDVVEFGFASGASRCAITGQGVALRQVGPVRAVSLRRQGHAWIAA